MLEQFSVAVTVPCLSTGREKSFFQGMWLDTIKAHVREEINTQTAKICLRIFSIVWYSLESQGFVLEHPGENILLPPCRQHSGHTSIGDVFCPASISGIMSAYSKKDLLLYYLLQSEEEKELEEAESL